MTFDHLFEVSGLQKYIWLYAVNTRLLSWSLATSLWNQIKGPQRWPQDLKQWFIVLTSLLTNLQDPPPKPLTHDDFCSIKAAVCKPLGSWVFWSMSPPVLWIGADLDKLILFSAAKKDQVIVNTVHGPIATPLSLWYDQWYYGRFFNISILFYFVF